MSSILVVDDEFDIAEVISSLLAEIGHAVRIAGNGREGIAMMNRERPDLVLLDLMMPLLDGPGTLRAMRADATLAKIPVVLMSAGLRAREVAAQNGCAGFLAKPFAIEQLLDTVDKLVGDGGS